MAEQLPKIGTRLQGLYPLSRNIQGRVVNFHNPR